MAATRDDDHSVPAPTISASKLQDPNGGNWDSQQSTWATVPLRCRDRLRWVPGSAPTGNLGRHPLISHGSHSPTGLHRVSGLTSHLSPQLLSAHQTGQAATLGRTPSLSFSPPHLLLPLARTPRHPSSPGRCLLSLTAQLRHTLPQKPALILHAHGGSPHPAASPLPPRWHTALSPELPIGPPTGLWAHGWQECALLTLDSQHAVFGWVKCLLGKMKEPLRLEPQPHNSQHSSP